MNQRVCIVGAGSSGIAAAQVLASRGIDFDCFETGSEVGGNWRYLNDNGMSSAYRSLHINTSRQIMEYASYGMDDSYPTYPNHVQIARYFDEFVDHWGLRKHIQFRTEVTNVVPAGGGGWEVSTRARGSEQTTTTRYAAVIVANGHHWDARMPEPAFPGVETFTGEQLHSHDYKTFDGFEGKRVLVLGIGNSACDIAVETSKVSARTFLAMRRGAHVLPKYVFGIPTDHLTTSPLARIRIFPMQRALLGLTVRLARGNVVDYGLPAPDHKIASAHPTISDDLLTRLGHGDITVKPNIERIDAGTVHFVDGTSEEIDRIVYCTGYKITFPFLDADLITAPDNQIELYHRVVDPKHPGLYFVGLVQPLGAIMPLAEAQAGWVADLLDGTATLPSDAEMQKEISGYRRSIAKRYVASKRHTIQVDFLEHLREIRLERAAGARRRGQSRALTRDGAELVSRVGH
ncbi:Predicted flavoprotein CzcO associated with the cation diffusion facilitator CzcD [Frankineae bacterium MT45]|nr:Predicted flavoprotein CzcO associated with the cation diffusion facilitator CzcD [Frankineae bacterium MT45]